MDTSSVIQLPAAVYTQWRQHGTSSRDTPKAQTNRFHGLLLSTFILLAILFNLSLRHRRLVKLKKGCRDSFRRAPVKDPFIGLDFIYQRLIHGLPATTLAEDHRDFRTLGSTYVVSRWTSQTVHTCDARNTKHMLATGFDAFKLPNVRVSVLSDLLGTGIFTMDGPAWSCMRALLRPSLTRGKMDTLPCILEKHVQLMLRHVRADGGGEVDLQPLFFQVTMDVASEFLLGRSTGMLSGASRSDVAKEFVKDYMACSTETVRKMNLGPLSVLGFNATAKKARQRVFSYMDDYIRSSLLESRRRQSESKEDGAAASWFLQDLAGALGEDGKMLRDQVLHIFLASRDTTASLLSNLFFSLARRPKVYARLRDEVVGMLGDGGGDEGSVCLTFEQLKGIKYLRWCVSECECPRLSPILFHPPSLFPV